MLNYNFEKYFQGYNYIPFSGVSVAVEEVVVAIEGTSVASKKVEKTASQIFAINLGLICRYY